MSDPPVRVRIDVGAPSGDGPEAAARFQRTLRVFTPKGYVTEVLIGLNVLVFVAMVALGVDPVSPTTANLIRWGADYGPRTTSGEWWRLFTAMFLHIGVVHVAMNMIVLFQIGRFVERLVGNAGFLVLYVVAGLVGSAASVLWNPYVVSAGASGAVFGLYGALLGILVRGRGSIPKDVLTRLSRSAIFFVGYNVVYGMSAKGIDMAAHLGGLGAGFVGGLVLSHRLEIAAVAARWRRNAALAAIGAAAIAAVVATAPRLVDLDAELQRMSDVETSALGAYNDAIGKTRKGTLGGEELAQVLETEILPPWRKEREALAAIHGLPDAQRALVGRTLEYMTAREEAFDLLAKAMRLDDAELARKATQKQAAADALAKKIVP